MNERNNQDRICKAATAFAKYIGEDIGANA